MLDIWTPVVSDDKLHPNFKALTSLSYYKETLSTIKSWTNGFVDRDGKIVKEFQTTFNSTYWEFYLNAVFTELNFDIDFSYSRPDFLLKKSDVYINAEATISSHPDGSQPEWERELPTDVNLKFMHEIVYLATIRMANTIQSKHKKFCEEYSKLKHVEGNPFILCIAPFEQPFFFAQGDVAIRRILYKFNSPLYLKNRETGKINIIGEEYTDKVIKDNNAEIELGFFTDERMKEISAIIFSNTATTTKVQALNSKKYPNTIFNAVRYNAKSWDKPHFIAGRGGEFTETILDGLHVFLNPYATIKFDPSLLRHKDIIFHYYDIDTNTSLTQVEDGALISHGCMNFAYGEKSMPAPLRDVSAKNFNKKIPPWEDDKLYELNARVGLGINNHIAHYKGWTIVVFQDSIDNDWAAIAKPVLVYEIQQFILYQGDDIGISNFYASKSEAYCAIKNDIDSTTKTSADK